MNAAPLAPIKLAPRARAFAPGPADIEEAAYLAQHRTANRLNLARVPGFPPLSSHDCARRDAQAQGRAAPFGAPIPDDVRPGSAWATWFLQGNGPLRDV